MLIFKIGNKRIKLSSRDRRIVSNKEVLMYLSMLSPRVGGVGRARGI